MLSIWCAIPRPPTIPGGRPSRQPPTPARRVRRAPGEPRYTPGGRSRRAHDLRGCPFRCPEAPRRVSSNVAQNYPYGSETEAERAAAVARAVSEFEGLGDRIAAAATPPGAPGAGEGWWVWVCPGDGAT